MSVHDNEGDKPIEHLRDAERDLKEALQKEQEAHRAVEKAEVKVEEAIRELEHPEKSTVKVIYDGDTKEFEIHPEETVKKLLDQAIAAFGPLPQPHILSLFEGAKELNDTSTLKDAGVKPGDTLLLRPSKVKGGA